MGTVTAITMSDLVAPFCGKESAAGGRYGGEGDADGELCNTMVGLKPACTAAGEALTIWTPKTEDIFAKGWATSEFTELKMSASSARD